MWISGSLTTYFYIPTIKAFLGDQSKSLAQIRNLSLFSSLSAALCLIIWGALGINLFLDETTPTKHYNNLFMQHIGGMNPSIVVKLLAVIVIFTSIYTAAYFIRYIFKYQRTQKLLFIGVIFSLITILIDSSISFWDPKYLAPVIMISHLFEILRMTYANQVRLGKKLAQLTNDLIQTSKLSEAGSHYALLAHEVLNPLAAAVGYTERLYKLSSQTVTPEIEDCYLKIHRQHAKIESLAKNVKKYTRMSSQSKMQLFSLDAIIQDAIETINISAYNANVAIDYIPHDENLYIACYQDQIIQVVTNVLNNGIEAISNQPDKWIQIRCSKHWSQLE
jgi:signal transduction histidine kinase